MNAYIGTMRVIAYCQDEVEATLVMDKLRQECEELLDEEDGDSVTVTQITESTSNISPEETLVVLRRARNALIRTRIKECFDLAPTMDEQIYHLGSRYDPSFAPVYDYGRIITIAEAILNKGEDPHD